ncbi:MAG: phenylacetic acid degradation b [Cyclobacteriaceae bacterium]|nr:phenylacetic acid degradation b [Cyclobacteriaceae bacterium]MCH8514832.1 phenylacetic acid degradation b [Cyclobacteriaceae bacterium]
MTAILESLDPRVKRMGITAENLNAFPTPPENDQFATYQVIIEPKEGKGYESAGIVHAPDAEIAFLFGKEQYSRRFTCSGMAVAATADVLASPFTENKISVYDLLEYASLEENNSAGEFYEVFHLYKRGKQHSHWGRVKAVNPEQALYEAKEAYDHSKPVYNIWLIASDNIFFADENIKQIWDTLPLKTHRDVRDYKAQDKINAYKERIKSNL